MTIGTVILVCVAVALLVLLARRRLQFVSAFRNIPGPPSLPFFGNALQLNGSPSDFFRLLREWHLKYGPTYQLWIGLRPFLSISDADHILQILSSSLHIHKNLEYDLLHPFIGTGLVTSAGSKWHVRRKLLTPTFHFNILEEFLPPIVRQSKILVLKLQKELSRDSGFDMTPYAKMVALDIIGNTAMGCEINSQINSDCEYVKAIDELTAIMQKRFITPWLKPNIIFNMTRLGKRQKHCINIIHSFTKKVISDRKNNLKSNATVSDANKNEIYGKRSKALLDLMIDVSDNGNILSDEDIQEEVDTFMFAGVDTSSTTLSWAMYVLGKHPEAQDQILAELDEKLPNFVDEIPTVRELSGLEYLDRTIREVMRLYPTVPLIGRQIYEPLTIGEHVIMPGTSVMINTYALHRSKIYFDNPDEFDPDRFLADNKHDRHPFAFLPFSAGPRNCIGQRFAIIVLKIAVATILKSYKIRSLDCEEDLGLVGEIVLRAEHGINITIEERT
ncbi:cytochrome P450 4C1-like [Daktulosphaira vitifoliae]|uniref:cytochrome P450 4C1-like n=1 Tax=Daktulosphaira vitifoliae TaxID=58002 RepID=UPI0021A9CF70|nr:cytochrome P450 4C1-like [Daktulosphaira vitifoliae]